MSYVIISYFATVKLRERTRTIFMEEERQHQRSQLGTYQSFLPILLRTSFHPVSFSTWNEPGDIKISRKSNSSLPDRISFFEWQLPTSLGIKVIQSLTRWNLLDWRRHPGWRPWWGSRWRSWWSTRWTGPGRGCWSVVPTVCAGPRAVGIVLQLEVLVEVGGRLPSHLLQSARSELVAGPPLCSFLLLPAIIDKVSASWAQQWQ